MKQIILNIFRFLFFLGLGIFLVWFAVKDITGEQRERIFQSFREANYWWALLSMLVGFAAHLSRAVRWKMLLGALEFSPKLSSTFYAVMIGYLGNLALHRLGEVLRCGILKRYEKISFTQALGTVVAERIIDLLILVILFIISAWVEYKRLHSYISANILVPLKIKFQSYAENPFLLLFFAVTFMLIFVLIILFRKKIFQSTIILKVKKLLLNFCEGFRTVGKVKNFWLFAFHSLFIWLMYFLSVYVCVFSFEESKTLTLSSALAIMAFGSIGVIATPGGIGAYQLIVLKLMLLWGFSETIGHAFGWIVWLAQVLLVLLFGVFSLVMLSMKKKS